MATAIRIPDIGTTVDHVKLVSWKKVENDTVKRGDVLCEVETDKAVSELESIAEGVLLKRMAAEGSDNQQGAVIAYIGAPGEAVPVAGVAAAPAAAGAAAMARAAATSGGIRVAPVIRNLARTLGVDLARVQASGPGGLITREDVLRAKETGGAAPAAAPEGAAISAHQAAIARRVAQSQREIPPINLVAHFDMTATRRRRREFEATTGRTLSYDTLFVAAAAAAVKEFPHFRTRLTAGGDRLITTDAVNIGVAISPGDDLYTPVIRAADNKSLATIEAELRALVEKARQGRFKVEEVEGAALTISNLGMHAVVSFAAIIPPGQAAVLALGAVEERVVARDGQPAVVFMATVTLSVDHRLINGREAGRFLARVKERMEQA